MLFKKKQPKLSQAEREQLEQQRLAEEEAHRQYRERMVDFFYEEEARSSLEKALNCSETPIQRRIESLVTNSRGYLVGRREPKEISQLEFQIYLGVKEVLRFRQENTQKLNAVEVFHDIIASAPALYDYRQYDAQIEEEKRSKYTLSEIIGQLTRRGIYREWVSDCSFFKLFEGKKISRVTKEMATTYAAFGAIVVPHELIHAGVNSATGGINHEIVLNRLFGGDIFASIIPGIEVKVLNPLLGGYVYAENHSALAELATSVAPYSLTILGFYALQKGKEKKNIPLCALGSAAVCVHVGGIIGDWFNAGQNVCYEAMEGIYNFIGAEPSNENSVLDHIIIGSSGMLLGLQMLKASYRLMKGTVNSLRQWYAEKSSFPMLPPHH